eukprot:TRINITY_DN2008_c0_g2_i1.p1 TRINITY_DN2008_c0_g2~~TRINITY_DN2008_c0_g2_i1.p1  ORF type:complete len:832 (-),score=171.48 TRINITY_DN2008_c0_g2_i1:370-2865(-)
MRFRSLISVSAIFGLIIVVAIAAIIAVMASVSEFYADRATSDAFDAVKRGLHREIPSVIGAALAPAENIVKAVAADLGSGSFRGMSWQNGDAELGSDSYGLLYHAHAFDLPNVFYCRGVDSGYITAYNAAMVWPVSENTSAPISITKRRRQVLPSGIYVGSAEALNQTAWPATFIQQPVNYNCSDRPWFKSAVEAGRGVTSWGSPYLLEFRTGPVPGITVAHSISYSTDDPVVVGVDFSVASLVERVLDVLPTENSMAAIYDATSGYLLASTTPPANVSSPEDAPIAPDIKGCPYFSNTTTYTNVTTTVNGTVTWYMKEGYVLGFATAERCLMVQRAVVEGTFPSGYLGVVVPVTRAGLNWSVVVAVPEKDVFGDITLGTRITIGIAIGIGVLAILVSVLCAWLCVSRPLGVLGGQLAAAAAFDLTSEPFFCIPAEVASMQTSFQTMQRHLGVFREYLPQGLFAQLFESSEEDAAVGDRIIISPRGGTVRVAPATSSAGAADLSGDLPHASSQRGRSVGSERSSKSGARSVVSRDGSTSTTLTKHMTEVERRAKYAHAVQLAQGIAARVTVATVLVLRIRMPEVLPAARLPALQQIVGSIVHRVAEENGVVEAFSGDEVSVTFNVHQTCSRHPAAAASTAFRILADCNGLADAAAFLPAIGIATGSVLSGAVSVERFRSMVSTGRTARVARLLPSLLGERSGVVCASLSAASSVEGTVGVKTRPFAPLVVPWGVSVPVSVVDSVGGVGAGFESEEWMYQLDANARGAKVESEHSVYDRALHALMSDSESAVSDAASLLRSPEAEPHDVPTLALLDLVSHRMAPLKATGFGF